MKKHRRIRRRYNGKRRSDRHRSLITFLLILLFAVAVAVGSVFLGKHLKEKAELSALDRENYETSTDTQKDKTTETENILSSVKLPQRVNGEFLALSDIDSYAPTEETNDVSIILKDNTGALLYSSPAARLLGIQNEDDALPTADEIIAKLHEKGCYVSVFVALTPHAEENSAYTDTVHAFESSIIGELSKAGADEIILFGIDKLNEIRLEDLISLSSLTRKENGNSTPIGVVLPYSAFEDTNANEYCRELSKYYEILSVDLTDIKENEEITPETELDERLYSLQMYFSRYLLRAIFDAESQIKGYELEALKNLSVSFYQRIKFTE